MRLDQAALRAVVFALASLSFACLLGHFYGLWEMRVFACFVLPPATLALAGLAWWKRGEPASLRGPKTWIVEGTLGGLAAAVAYDAYRLPFVLSGAPLFKPFPQFGAWILGADEPRWLVQSLGWAYHFSNGAALGIMFLAMVGHAGRRGLFWGAVAWALAVECLLLLTPYAAALGLARNGRFLFLTASAHLVFGFVLGTWCQRRVT